MSAQKRLVNFRHSITSGNSRANVCHGVDFDVPLPITAGLERQARFHPGCTLTLDEKLRAVSGRIVLYLSAFWISAPGSKPIWADTGIPSMPGITAAALAAS